MNDMDMFLEMLEGLRDKEAKKQDFDEEALSVTKQMFRLKQAFVKAGFTSQEAFELVKSSMEVAIR